MEYISAEEFLKQSEKVQDNLKTWVESNFSEYDLVKLVDEGSTLWIDSVIDTRKDDIDVGRVFYLGRCICWSSIYEPNLVPLFTENHLRKFIEEKTNKKVWVSYNLKYCEGQTIIIQLGNDYTEFKKEHECFAITTNDLIQAYWQVAIKIAEI